MLLSDTFIYVLAHIRRNVDQKFSFEWFVSLVSNPLYVLNYDSISKYIISNRIKMIQRWYSMKLDENPHWRSIKPQHIKTTSHVEEVFLLFVDLSSEQKGHQKPWPTIFQRNICSSIEEMNRKWNILHERKRCFIWFTWNILFLG